MEETKLMSPDPLQTSEDRESLTTRTMETDNVDESVSSVVSDIVQLSVSDLNELMQLVKQWDAEERATSQTDDTAAASSTQQNIEEYLKWFFDQRRKFAEHLWDEESKDVRMVSTRFTNKSSDTLEEPTSSLFAISGDNRTSSQCSVSAILEVTKADGLARKTLFKRIKETWRKRFGRKSNNEGGSFSESQDDEDSKDGSLSRKSDQSLSRKSDQMSVSSKDLKEPDEDPAESLSSFSPQQPITQPLEVRPTEEEEDHVAEIQLPSEPQEEEEPVLSRPQDHITEIPLPSGPPEEKEPALSKEVTSVSHSPVLSKSQIESEGSESPASGSSSKSMKMESSGFTTESPDILEKVVFVAEAEPTSSLSTISGEKRKSSSASSLCSTSAIFEVTNVVVVQGTEQSVRRMESTDSDSKAEQPAGTTIMKRIRKTWRERFGRKRRMNEDGSVSESQEDEDLKDRSLSLKSDQMSISSKDQKEPDEDPAESLSSFSLQQPITQPLEVRPAEEEEDHVTEIPLPSEPQEEEEPVLSKEVTSVSHSPVLSKDQIKSEGSESLASGDSSCCKNIITTETSGFTTESPDATEDVVFGAEAESTSRLSTISGDKRKSSSVSSLCSNSAILEMTNVDVAHGTEQSVRTLGSTDSDSKTEQSAGSLFKRIKESWRKRFGRKRRMNEDGSVSESQEDEDLKNRSLSLKSDQMSISSKNQKEPDEDRAESLSSFSLQQSITQPLEARPTEGRDEDHITEIHLRSGPPEEEPALSKEVASVRISPVKSEDQIQSEERESLASGACSCFEAAIFETLFHADLVKEVFVSELESTSNRKSPSASSACSTSAILEPPAQHLSSFGLHQLLTGPLEVDGPPEEERENSDSPNDQQIVLNPSVFSIILETFFHHLTEEQWREVGEGVYNHDVLEKLICMCMTVLRFISNAVVKVVLLSLSQSSDTCGASPMTSEDLLRAYNIDIPGFVESCFSQAVCDVIGADMPVRVSPEFTDTLATEVLQEVNSVLSVTQQASVDGAPTISDSSQESNKRAAEKTVGGLIATMKSFLTGRATAVRRRIETQTDEEVNAVEATPARGAVIKSKQSLWSRCVRRQESRQLQLVPSQEDCGNEDSTSPHSSISNTLEERSRNRGLFSSKEKQKMEKE